MHRQTTSYSSAMRLATTGYLRPQITCGVKRFSGLNLEGWDRPATGSCIGGTV